MEDSQYSELKRSLSAISVKVLNYSSRLKLAHNLDTKQVLLSEKGFSRDYRGLAELVGFQFYAIKRIEEFEDRTMKILESWETRPDATLDKLITYLAEMDRHDIIQELIPSLKKNVEAYLEYQKSVCPIQVDEISSDTLLSIRKWAVNIDELQNGERATYDVYVSYADEDTSIANQFASILESPEIGLKLFIRGRDMLAGMLELETNVDLIKNKCRRVLLILTPNFVKSPGMAFYLDFAGSLAIEQKERILVPVILVPCEIPPILSSVCKIDFTKQDTQDWMWHKLISSLLPNDKKVQQSIGNETSNSACFVSAENKAIAFPPSAKYSLSSAVEVNSNALLCSAPSADISDEEKNFSLCSEMHHPAACSESKDVSLPSKESSKRFQQFMSFLKRKGSSTSASSKSFSSNATN